MRKELFVTCFCLAPSLSVFAHIPQGVVDASGLFLEQTVDMQAMLCSKRVPSSAATWRDAVGKWKANNREALDQLQRSTDTLMRRSREDEAIIQGVMTLGAGTVTRELAGSPDAAAAQMCSRWLGQFSNREMDSQLREAKAGEERLLKMAPRH
jgi:hypothetical protein